MSIEKSLSLNDNNGHSIIKGQKSAKRRHSDRRSSSREVTLEQGKRLKDMDSNKLKAEIKRWAKAVVAYARQISGRFGSS
ncbi:hypothetical protein TanjilG_31611 [Lupinus angustifolius]|uniref:Uncharacterized protein n=1 Tax=Lupinus angustifolius TaxID=3871 RepID=A0A4P1RIT0_LUPAN|nr:hypothetical protein TanjilG_31611 [Lupinus angustifolius]